MGINVWLVDKTDDEGCTQFVDCCETFDEAVEAVLDDWYYEFPVKNSRWLSEPIPSKYTVRGWYMYEVYQPPTREKASRVWNEYYIYNFIKGE